MGRARSSVVLVAVAALGVGVGVGCGSDNDIAPLVPSPKSSATGTTAGSSSTGAPDGSVPTPNPTGTTPIDGGGGADSSTPPAVNAFTGAPAYVATLGQNARKNDHGNGGNPAKLACLSCHRQGGNAPRWFAGGTVFTEAAGTTPAARVEIRFRDATGKAVSTYSDADGNFYLTPNQAQGLTFPLQVGARDATNVRPMVTMLSMGDCSASACHGNASVGAVHVP